MDHPSALTAPAPPFAADRSPLQTFVTELRSEFHQRICAVLLYGSCLRSGDVFDGIVDLYLICDDYRSAYHRRALSVGNWLLPPNVFYRQQTFGERILRGKITVISLPDFQRGCSMRWFESYIWGRFAQPVEVLYCRDTATRSAIANALDNAAATLLRRALPVLPETGTLSRMWEQALSLSYGTELRSERRDRALSIVAYSEQFYLLRARGFAATPGSALTLSAVDGEWRYHYRPAVLGRSRGHLAWFLRRLCGKLLSILRLLKALYTFDVGLDYIAWKLERHTGEIIEIPDKVRSAPLIHLWGFAWGLYRRGIFK